MSRLSIFKVLKYVVFFFFLATIYLVYFDFSRLQDVQPAASKFKADSVQSDEIFKDADEANKVEAKKDTDFSLSPDLPHIVDCRRPEEEISERIIEEIEELDSQLTSLTDELQGSTDLTEYEELLVALLSQNDKYRLLKAYLSKYPDSLVASWSLINHCASGHRNAKCDKSDEFAAIEADGSNGALWLVVAGLRAERKEFDSVVDALRNAATAPIFEEHFGTQIESLRNYLSGYDEAGASITRFEYIISYVTTNLINTSSVFEFCEEHSSQRADLHEVCLDLGRTMESEGKTLLTNSLGLALQKKLYHSANESQVLAAEMRLKAQREFYRGESYSKASSLLEYDDELLNYWFDSIVHNGERQAMQLLIEEAIRLSSNQGYNPCSVRNKQ